jgi:hypothetical protein
MRLRIFLFSLVLVFLTSLHGTAWSNGGNSANPDNPDYGTHDWIAENAVNFLPANDSVWIKNNMVAYLIGTEAPDNSEVAAAYTTEKVYGDKSSGHHNYYNLEHTSILDDSASQRAQEEYDKSLKALRNGDYRLATFHAGAMSHYISDIAVWSHVRGGGSPHGSEDSKKHSEYETEVDRTITAKFYTDSAHTSSIFQEYMAFDGRYENTTAYSAAFTLGMNTDSGGGSLDCVQMEQLLPMGPAGDGSNIGISDWSQSYRDRSGESLNLAANSIADILYTLNRESGRIAGNPPVSEPPRPAETGPIPIPSIKIDSKLGTLLVLVIILLLLMIVFNDKGNAKSKRRKKRGGRRRKK